jgi:hypothetical protein
MISLEKYQEKESQKSYYIYIYGETVNQMLFYHNFRTFSIFCNLIIIILNSLIILKITLYLGLKRTKKKKLGLIL